MEKLCVMFDSNEYDKLILLDDETLSKILKKVVIKITCIQYRELSQIPIDEKIKKGQIDKILDITKPITEEVANSFSFSHLKFSKLSFIHGSAVDVIQGNSKQNDCDSLIADAAVRNGCILITDDKKLFEHMEKNGYDVMNFVEFIELVQSV